MPEATVAGVAYDATTPAPDDRLEAKFGEKKPLMSRASALAEAHRCLYCHDAPCIKACPTAIDIPTFIRKIGSENVAGSARVILESNILGLSCATVCPTEVLCEGDCVYNHTAEPPIAIGRLQKYATEYAYERGLRFFERGEPNGKKVALVGAGPASLACAHELAILGYESVIFEARALPGGLNTTGVAPYKLKVPDSLREIRYILEIGGIELRTGVNVGQDISFAALENEFDAVFIGVGLGADGRLGLDGEDLDGIVGAVEVIERLKTESGYDIGSISDVVILGGGNTAIDVVREFRGLGVPHVTMVYRRDEQSMSGYTHEWDGAKQEGARASWWSQPVGYVGEGHVRAVRCARTKVVDGRLVVTDDTFELDADLVVLAVGQEKLEAMFSAVDGVAFARGKLVIDADTGATGNPKYFAGGDCANGGKEVVNAAAEGMRAARGIHASLTGGSNA